MEKTAFRGSILGGIQQWADSTAFAGEGHEVIVSTVATAGTRKAVRKDAAFQILTECLAHIRLGSVVVALTVELPRAGQIKPSLVVLGYGLVKQCALGVARVVEFEFGRIWHEQVF